MVVLFVTTLVVLQLLGELIKPFLELFLILPLFLLLGHTLETLLIKDTDVQIVAQRLHGLVQIQDE